MSNPLSGVLNKARTSLGGPLAGFQGPQTMQMPRRRPMPTGGAPGMPMPGNAPSMPFGLPSGMLPQTAVSAPPMGGGMPAVPMNGFGNTGIVPPHMQQNPTGARLAEIMRKMKLGGMMKVNPLEQPSMPSAPPGAGLA